MHHHIAEDDEELTNGDNSGDMSKDLAIDENIIDPVEDRRTLAERSERLHDQLKVSYRTNKGLSGNFHSLNYRLHDTTRKNALPSSINKIKKLFCLLSNLNIAKFLSKTQSFN